MKYDLSNKKDSRDRAQPASADASMRAYAADAAAFAGWCDARGATAFPADAMTVIEFMLAEEANGASPNTISRRRHGIAHAHYALGFEPPKSDVIVEVLRAITNRGNAQEREPVNAVKVEAMAAECGAGATGARNRALLLLAWHLGLRRASLVAMDWSAVTFGGDLAIIKAEGRSFVFAREQSSLCCVSALQEWHAYVSSGPLLRPINKAGLIGEARLSSTGANRIVKGLAKSAGIEGITTDCFAKGARWRRALEEYSSG